jgi:hypothetical protein
VIWTVTSHFLAVWLEGRNPQYSGVTVKVNGSSGQVVSIDNDPNAPAAVVDRHCHAGGGQCLKTCNLG